MRSSATTIVTTGTASGKSLCFQLPTLDVLSRDARARALFLYPSKALAQDQARSLHAFGVKRARPAIYDGDTPREQRADLRRRANVVLTNPDMLHLGILPNHPAWGDFFKNLAIVVIDEAHVYRGVFGSHVANVLRRLRRVCEIHGTVAALPAGVGDGRQPGRAGDAADRVRRRARDRRATARPGTTRTIAMWNPPVTDEATMARRSPLAEAADLLASLVIEGARTIVFMKSRKAVELMARFAVLELERARASRAGGADRALPRGLHARSSGASWRRGWCPASCSAWSRPTRWSSASTSARSTRRSASRSRARSPRCGRCGGARGGAGAGWRSTWPARTRSTSSSAGTRTSSSSARSRRRSSTTRTSSSTRRTCCARRTRRRWSRPTRRCSARAGASSRRCSSARATCASARTARSSRAGRRSTRRATFSLRSASRDGVAIVNLDDGEVIGDVDIGPAPSTVHQGAIYLHGGRQFEVVAFDFDDRRALVRPFDGHWYTQVKRETDTHIERVLEERVGARRAALLRHRRRERAGAGLPAPAAWPTTSRST